MRRIVNTVAALLISGALIFPPVQTVASTVSTEQSSRPNRGNSNGARRNNTTTARPNNTGNSGSRPASNSGNRPSKSPASSRPAGIGNHSGTLNGPVNGNLGNRPNGGNNNSGNHNGNRPNGGNNNNGNHTGNRPNGGNNNNGNHNGNRPNGGNNSLPGQRPAAGSGANRPGSNNGFRPGHNTPGPNMGHRPPNPGLPMRPHMPPMRPFHRPVPPPAWRPVGRYPVLSTILGVTLGTALNISINALVNSGYTVSGYGDNMVFLTNVPQLNFTWPDATLYYAPNGGLMSSQFVYSTPYNDMGRYNSAFSRLVNLYGQPVSYDRSGGEITASWFGNNGQFVTLSFAPRYTASGALGYFTTLSFGN